MDLPGASLILDQPLRIVQEQALEAAGYTLVETPPSDAPYLVFAEHLWFTRDLLHAIRTAGTGRLFIDDPAFLHQTRALQTDAARPPIAVVPAGGAPTWEGLPDLPIDLGLSDTPPMQLHPAFQHADKGVFRTGTKLVHAIEHWTHLLRVNLLALVARGAEGKKDFDESPWWRKLGMAIAVLWKAGSLEPSKLGKAISRIGKGAKIHPTAVVEACEIGEGAEIGPYAYVRASYIGKNAKVEPYARVLLAVVGEGARVGPTAMFNLGVLYPGAYVSAGGGYQMCIFGRDCFVAVGATFLDLSFGKTVRVVHNGARVDSETHFLGSAIGHRVKVGNGVRVSYGMAIPNDVFLVANADDLLREWPEPITGPVMVEQGRAVPVKRA